MDFGNAFLAAEQRRMEQERRRHHNRVRVVVTAINIPEDPADEMWLQVRATKRLLGLMTVYAKRCGLKDGFFRAPQNVLPQHGRQLRITESALEQICPDLWSSDVWVNDDVSQKVTVWAINDFIYNLSGYYAQVQFSR